MSKEYSKEFKLEAVQRSQQDDQTVAQVARELGISKSALYRWRRELVTEAGDAFPGKGNLGEKDAEIRRLQRELREAQMEVEILKKATAIFARAKK